MIKHFFLAIFLLFFCGCASVQEPSAPVQRTQVPAVPGIYHRVEKGQTLWRITRMYGVSLDEVVEYNKISDATSIEVGQLIFIPRGEKPVVLPVESLGDDFIWPIRGKVIGVFGKAYENLINKGLNIEPYGGLDVVASRAGRVVFCMDNFGEYGKTVIIDHGDGFSTVYARNSQNLVSAGENVPRGRVIARAGSAGGRQVYLHFEVRKGYTPQNPYYYLP